MNKEIVCVECGVTGGHNEACKLFGIEFDFKPVTGEKSKACILCGTVFDRLPHVKNYHWNTMRYCSVECRIIVGHMRSIINSSFFRKAYEIVRDENKKTGFIHSD